MKWIDRWRESSFARLDGGFGPKLSRSVQGVHCYWVGIARVLPFGSISTMLFCAGLEG